MRMREPPKPEPFVFSFSEVLQAAMSGEKKQKPEELLAKIRRIEDNKYCVNCGEYAKLGHTNVCGRIVMHWNHCLVPYSSFVCHMCKSAHQSFSHRVKVFAILAE